MVDDVRATVRAAETMLTREAAASIPSDREPVLIPAETEPHDKIDTSIAIAEAMGVPLVIILPDIGQFRDALVRLGRSAQEAALIWRQYHQAHRRRPAPAVRRAERRRLALLLRQQIRASRQAARYRRADHGRAEALQQQWRDGL